MLELTADLQGWPQQQALVVMAGVVLASLYGGFKLYKIWHQRAQLKNLPRSRVRSAAQGYVELEGMASPYFKEATLHAPLSGKRCLWFHSRVEKRVHEHSRGSRHTRWQLIEEKFSDELFCLEDETGECAIDPDFADVQTLHQQRWNGTTESSRPPQQSGGISLQSGDYRFTERLILNGDPLYALGYFRTLAQNQTPQDQAQALRDKLREWKSDPEKYLRPFDLDRDGRISKQEWQQAVAAARAELQQQGLQQAAQTQSHLLSRDPDSRRPYVLAAMSQEQLENRQFWQMVMYFGLLLFGSAAALWLATARGWLG